MPVSFSEQIDEFRYKYNQTCGCRRRCREQNSRRRKVFGAFYGLVVFRRHAVGYRFYGGVERFCGKHSSYAKDYDNPFGGGYA